MAKLNMKESITMREKIAKGLASVAKKAAYKVVGKSFPLCVYESAPPKELIHKKDNK